MGRKFQSSLEVVVVVGVYWRDHFLFKNKQPKNFFKLAIIFFFRFDLLKKDYVCNLHSQVFYIVKYSLIYCFSFYNILSHFSKPFLKVQEKMNKSLLNWFRNGKRCKSEIMGYFLSRLKTS